MQNNKKVLIIYTGGTIGMSKTDNGYAPEMNTFLEMVNKIDELKNPKMPKWDIISLHPILDSSNISLNEWNKIAELVYENYDQYDGFVILHGTDTMAYSASALSFMLENNSKPIIFTGSQIPLCEIRNDARDNLITSLMIASDDRISEVCLYFGGKLLRGNRAIKYSSDGTIYSDDKDLDEDLNLRLNLNCEARRLKEKVNRALYRTNRNEKSL